MLNRFRKGKVLVEIVTDFSQYRNPFLERADHFPISEGNFRFRHNFSVHLQNQLSEISPSKIAGFKLKESISEKILTVETLISINEWIDDFKSVDYAKILFYDSSGNVNRLLDFDIDYVGHRLECSYAKQGILSPVFEYKIFS
jgi:hypothetical protein